VHCSTVVEPPSLNLLPYMILSREFECGIDSPSCIIRCAYGTPVIVLPRTWPSPPTSSLTHEIPPYTYLCFHLARYRAPPTFFRSDAVVNLACSVLFHTDLAHSVFLDNGPRELICLPAVLFSSTLMGRDCSASCRTVEQTSLDGRGFTSV
jgi:hypothetical protein